MARDPFPSSRAPSSYRDVELGHPLSGPNASSADGDGPAGWEQEEQQALLDRQDSTLDALQGTLGTIGGQARLMGQEVHEQNGMLDALDSHVDSTEHRLAKATKRMTAFIAQAEEKGSGWCILILTIVLCILLVAVILL